MLYGLNSLQHYDSRLCQSTTKVMVFRGSDSLSKKIVINDAIVVQRVSKFTYLRFEATYNYSTDVIHKLHKF